MMFHMTKKALDTWGGVGSMLLGLVCVYFASEHHRDESIWKVFVGMCVLLVLNGVAMVLSARRPRQKGVGDAAGQHPMPLAAKAR